MYESYSGDGDPAATGVGFAGDQQSAEPAPSEAELAQQQGMDISERVEDVGKAQDMAEAGHEPESEAALNQQWVYFKDKYTKKYTELKDRTYTAETAEETQVATVELNTFVSQLDQEAREILSHYPESEQAQAVERNMGDIWWVTSLVEPFDNFSAFRFPEEQHNKLKNKANRVESWAAVLHDHPVSPEYQARVGFEITPAKLFELEEKQLRIGLEIERFKEIIEGYKKRGRLHVRLQGEILDVDGPDDRRVAMSAGDLLRDAAYQTAENQGNPELYCQESAALKKREAELSDPNTTVATMEQFYSSLLDVAYIEPAGRSRETIRQILDDVESGRASEQPEQVLPQAEALAA